MFAWVLNLGFAASPGEAAVVADVVRKGGAGGYKRRRRYRYPRRIMVEGRTYWAKSAEEERAILEQYLARVEAEALELVQNDAPPQEIAQARVQVVRAVRRLDETDERETAWLDRLRREDEEILAVLLH